MEYRKIKKEEFSALRRVHSLVYFMKYDEETTDTYPGADENRWKYGRGAFDDDGKILAVLESIPFDSYLDGNIVGSPGIAGVATLSEERRNGHIRKLLELIFNEMHENGDVMSYLYPFSHEYYRKFGYSQACTSIIIYTDLSNIVISEHKGYTRQYFPGGSFDDLKTIYNSFSRKFNCSVDRKDWRWKREYSEDPYKTKTRVFIRYNEKDEPVAYIKFKTKEVEQYTYDMIVTESAWTGGEGPMALAAIINGYRGDLRKIKLEVPSDFPIGLLAREVWKQDSTIRYTGMNRIVDACQALEMMKKPEKPGKAVIGLDDGSCPWNTGKWLVEWENGSSQVSKTNRRADLICRSPEFSQLVIGRYTAPSLKDFNKIEITGNETNLYGLFVKKPCFIWDRF